MTTYQKTVENYGPNGFINSQVIQFTLTGEQELAFLGDGKLKNAYTTLRQWAADAETESAAWNTQTQAQRDAAMTATFHRLSVFFDRFADLLLLEGRS